MKIASQILNFESELSDEAITVLSVENVQAYRMIVCAFENGSIDEHIVFSSDFKPFEFYKKGIFISNPLNIGFVDKRFQNKINARLLDFANETEQVFKLKSTMLNFADDLVKMCDFNLTYDSEFDLMDFIKMMAFKVNTSDLSFSEVFVKFVLMMSEYLSVELFVVLNLHLCFTRSEIEHIFETLLLNHIVLISLNRIQPQQVINGEKHIVIDKDLCLIDNSLF